MPAVTLYESFNQRPLLPASLALGSNLNFCLVGTNAADANSLPYVGGGAALATAGADNDQIIAVPHTTANQTVWKTITINPSEAPVVEFAFVTAGSIASLRIEMGVRATPTAFTDAADNDKFCLVFDTAAANATWQLLTSTNATPTNTNTTVAVGANTVYYVRMSVDPVTFIVTCSIWNGLSNSAPTTVTSPALANVAQGLAYIGVKALTGSAKGIRVQRVSLNQSQSTT